MPGTGGHSNHQIRTRSERVASVVLRPRLWSKLFEVLRKDLRVSLILLMLLFNLFVCCIIEAWKPPFPYRLNDVPNRPIHCQTPFQIEDPGGTEAARERAVRATPPIYTLDSQPLIQERDALINIVTGLVQTATFEETSDPRIWIDFLPVTRSENAADTTLESKTLFDAFKSAFGDEAHLQAFQESLKNALKPLEEIGFLTEFSQKLTEKWNQEQVWIVLPDGKETKVYSNEVLLGDASRLQRSLSREFSNDIISQAFFRWLLPRIKRIQSTLKLDEGKTAAAIEKAVAAVPTVFLDFPQGKPLAPAGKEIGPTQMRWLWEEYKVEISQMTLRQKFSRFFCIYFLIVVAHFIGWVYMYRRERRKPKTLTSSALTIFFMLLAIATAKLLDVISNEQGLLALIPLLIFAQSLAITFSWELSMVLSLNLAFILVLADGTRFGTMLILVGTTIAVIEQLGRLRSRKKLIAVGLIAGAVSSTITFAAGLLDGRMVDAPLWTESLLNGLWTLTAAVAMSGILPFIERPFGILTDMSLLELGDLSHPLLQELIRRAPATYSHSIQVGSIAEAASEAIGARSLMTRVGAYFHDIGKILKPQFFSENQTSGENVHDTLEPRMSSLVIVAHVKDGADLARQHRLPQPLIDLIEQHHGTSLVSYFYGMASRQNKDNPYGQGVEESSFRYPGPKPQSKEAGILMLADASESAVRSMGDSATPGRIENMVRQITETKLKDGQFDDCGLTLHELRVVENSIIKSLIAVRHTRIKYPGQGDKPSENPKSSPELRSPSAVKAGSSIVSDTGKLLKKTDEKRS